MPSSLGPAPRTRLPRVLTPADAELRRSPLEMAIAPRPFPPSVIHRDGEEQRAAGYRDTMASLRTLVGHLRDVANTSRHRRRGWPLWKGMWPLLSHACALSL